MLYLHENHCRDLSCDLYARTNGRVVNPRVDVGPDFEVVEYCGRLSCRKPIVQSPGRGRRREFCSETCRRGADRDYKRAKALVENFERNLRNFRHEVAAYGRKAELGAGLATPEEEGTALTTGVAALSRAQTALEFGRPDTQDTYATELRRLVEAITPLIEARRTSASA